MNKIPTSIGSKVMKMVEVLRNVGQTTELRSQSHRPQYRLKGFHQLSIHVKYKVSSLTVKKVMAKLKSRPLRQNFWHVRKDSSQEM